MATVVGGEEDGAQTASKKFDCLLGAMRSDATVMIVVVVVGFHCNELKKDANP